MKTLYIVRHGSAETKADETADTSRNLTSAGIDEIQYIARNLRDVAEYPDLIICSPASRALETAKIIAKKLKYPAEKIEIQNVLYESKSIAPLIQFLEQLSPELKSACLVGHNPLMADLAKNLCKTFVQDIPKGGLLVLEFPVESWSRLKSQTAIIKIFDFKDSEKNMRRQIYEKLTLEIYEDLSLFFSKKHEETMKHLRPRIMKSARRLGKKYLDLVEKKTGKIRKNKSWTRE